MTDELTEKMIEKGFDAEALHGDLRQNQRSMVLNTFKKGKGSILVATDVAARGIDVDNVEAVFNYDMPNNEEIYVHRIGRTGRAGKSGLAFTFCSNRDNLRTLEDIRKYTKAEISEGEIPGKEQLMIIKKRKIKEQIQESMQSPDIHQFKEIAQELLHDETLSPELVLSSLLNLQFGPLPTDDTVFIFASPKKRSDDRPERGSRFDRDRGGRDSDRRGSDRRGNDRGSFAQRDQPRSRSRQGDEAPAGRPEREFGRPKPARGSGEKMSRIFINLGKSARIKPGDLVGAIAGETGLAGDRIGHIEIFDHFSFVEVPQSLAREISETMSQVSIKGKTVHSEVARS
jgi:ATP-dependent RNA helicase DeaD